MAQSANISAVVETTETDLAAWVRVAKARKFEINDGAVWGFSDGRLLRINAPQGFALVSPASQLGWFASLTQYTLTRVGQTAKGDVQAAMDKAIADGEISDPKGYGAFEQAYRAAILDLIVAKIDPAFTLTVKNNPVKTAENRKNFEATVESQRTKRYDAIIAKAKANTPRVAGATTTRKPAAKGTAFEIGGLDDAV